MTREALAMMDALNSGGRGWVALVLVVHLGSDPAGSIQSRLGFDFMSGRA